MKDAQPILRFIVIAGGAVIAINSAGQIFKAKTITEGIMPVVGVLVGISAFSYAMMGQEVRLIPKP